MCYSIICFVFTVMLFLNVFANAATGGKIVVGTDLSSDPLSLTIALGGSSQSNVTVSGKGNPAPWPVDLSASSIGGVSTDFDPAHVIVPTGPPEEWHHNHSLLTISVSDAATPGVYNLTIYADFGSPERALNITLTIQERHGGDGEIMRLETTPVGGIIASENEHSIPALYLGLMGMVGVAACVTAVRRRRNRLKGLHDR